MDFRSSIAWLSDSLSTLRSTGHPDTTQDSLPGAGYALLGGLIPQGLIERFQCLSSFTSSSRRLLRAIPFNVQSDGKQVPVVYSSQNRDVWILGWIHRYVHQHDWLRQMGL